MNPDVNAKAGGKFEGGTPPRPSPPSPPPSPHSPNRSHFPHRPPHPQTTHSPKTSPLSNELLAQLSAIISEQTGLHFPEERFRDLERQLASVSDILGFKDVESCIKALSLKIEPEQFEILIQYITVGETYFYRDRKVFEALEKYVLPDMIFNNRQEQKGLRIWSAACSSGEEPYSLAVLLSRLIPATDLKKNTYSILATDINRKSLQKGIEGIYTSWSFRDAPSWLKENYFVQKRNSFEVKPRIREVVTFSYLNLKEDVYPSMLNGTHDMDLILCRNVLMYLNPPAMRQVIDRLHDSLADNGLLVVSPSESSQLLFKRFGVLHLPGAIFYKKIENTRRFGFDAKATSAASISAIPPATPPSTASPAPFAPSAPPMPSAPSLPPLPSVSPASPAPSAWPRQSQELPRQIPEPVKTLFITKANLDATGVEMERRMEAAGMVMMPGMNTAGGDTVMPVATYEEAEGLYNRGCRDEALERLTECFRRYPGDLRVIFLTAKIHADHGKLDEALQWCEKGVTRDKLNVKFYYLRATVLQEKGEVEEAIKTLEKVLYIDSKFVLAHYALGNLFRTRRLLDQSLRHFEIALSLLRGSSSEEPVPESEGLTAGRLKETIRIMTGIPG